MKCRGAVEVNGRFRLDLGACGRAASVVVSHRRWGTAPVCSDHEQAARSLEGVWIREPRSRSATLWSPQDIVGIEVAV